MKLQFKQNSLVLAVKAAVLSQLCIAPAVFAADAIKTLETIVVTAPQADAVDKKTVALEGFGTQELKKAPASISVLNADMIEDQHARILADVVKNDASVGDSYAPIGYYSNFVSRGFALDLGSSYLLNGNVVRGEQNLSLENKERVEILKGISAIQSGMSTPGGVVNYVSKRPADVKSVSFNLDEYGQFSVTTDLGGFTGNEQQFGYRVNLVGEQINSYVDHVGGKRYMGSAALDWNITDKSALQFDFESQRQQQRSVPGYQLLDGKVPQNVQADRLLAYQSWGKPVTMDSINSSLKYSYDLNDLWTADLIGAYSRVKIDDYSTFAWGCYSSVCQYSGLGNGFDANGNYDIYDYQNPDDTYVTRQLKAQLQGQWSLANTLHHVNLELAQTDKSRKRNDSLNINLSDRTGIVGNIYNDTVDLPPATEAVGARYKALDSSQIALTISDRIEFGKQWSALLGGKWIHLDEQGYNELSIQTRDTNLDKFLPQLALSYSPTDDITLYASYAKGLSDGRSAAWYAENGDDILAPIQSEQYELGYKQQINQFLLTAALFDLRQDNQYTVYSPAVDEYYFIAEGEQHSRGMELGVSGNITPRLSMNTTMAYSRTRLEDVSNAVYAGHQMQNAPKFRAASFMTYDLPQVEGLKLMAGGRYSSSKFANREATAKVGGYSVFDAGAAYTFKWNKTDAELRLNVDNLFNKKYWRDVGESDGDGYMFLGAPRTANLALKLDF
ncbi:TonB-dependent siderophore receptor [Acinetobacter sp. ANC 3813]|uniref:TonB-dependent siderophore receptor n=1 Tax=Acinetobacter sp. ANC 3813 TaxID=1977873 RepID=UPI000A356B76|nr:TonB-dependent siderophore receptor [Acinetobacter sp. ANC 3813]OTG91109.1 TonB-dependent siderophore receptor [Acinetobacter sp. ANC 3813]